MRCLKFALATILLMTFSLIDNSGEVLAQGTASQQEFVQSSSPLKSGGRVVSRSGPGQAVQTRAFAGTRPNTAATASRLRSVGDIQPVPASNASANSSDIRRTFRPQSQTRNDVYPYPATGAPRTAQLPTNTNAAFASRNWGRTYNPAASGQWRSQLPITTNRVAQNCNCAPGFQMPAAQPPATLPPALPGNVAQPGVSFDPAWNANTQFPPIQSNTAFGGGAFRNWWNPIVSGSGAYQPIIKLQNMPPGTYLGQGIIGQPTAYVDGQPVRNLLRYISP